MLESLILSLESFLNRPEDVAGGDKVSDMQEAYKSLEDILRRIRRKQKYSRGSLEKLLSLIPRIAAYYYPTDSGKKTALICKEVIEVCKLNQRSLLTQIQTNFYFSIGNMYLGLGNNHIAVNYYGRCLCLPGIASIREELVKHINEAVVSCYCKTLETPLLETQNIEQQDSIFQTLCKRFDLVISSLLAIGKTTEANELYKKLKPYEEGYKKFLENILSQKAQAGQAGLAAYKQVVDENLPTLRILRRYGQYDLALYCYRLIDKSADSVGYDYNSIADDMSQLTVAVHEQFGRDVVLREQGFSKQNCFFNWELYRQHQEELCAEFVREGSTCNSDGSGFSEVQKLYNAGVRKLIVQIAEENIALLELLGLRRPCDYEFVGFSSIARGELDLYSGLSISKLAFLVPDQQYSKNLYFQCLSKLIKLQLHLLFGEQIEIFSGNYDEIDFIVNTPEVLFLNNVTPGSIISLFSLGGEEGYLLKQYLALSCKKFNVAITPTTVKYNYVYEQSGAEWLDVHSNEYWTRMQISSDAGIINLTQHYLEPLIWICYGFALYFGVESLNIPQILQTMREKNLFEATFANRLLKIYEYLQKLRLNVHLSYKRHNDLVRRFPPASGKYLLSEEEQQKLQVIHLQVFQIYQAVRQLLDRNSSFSNLALFNPFNDVLLGLVNDETVDIALINQQLEIGVNIEVKDQHGCTPLHIAAKRNKRVMATLLQHRANPNSVDSYGVTPLHIVASDDNCEAIRLMVNFGADFNVTDKEGLSPLYGAVKNRCLDSARQLLYLGSNAVIRDKNGRTLLHLVVMDDQLQNNLEWIEMLVRARVSVSAQDKDGHSPLYEAVKKGDLKAVELLLVLGASVNFLIEQEGLVLLRTLNSSNGGEKIVEMLYRAGAQLEASMFSCQIIIDFLSAPPEDACKEHDQQLLRRVAGRINITLNEKEYFDWCLRVSENRGTFEEIFETHRFSTLAEYFWKQWGEACKFQDRPEEWLTVKDLYRSPDDKRIYLDIYGVLLPSSIQEIVQLIEEKTTLEFFERMMLDQQLRQQLYDVIQQEKLVVEGSPESYWDYFCTKHLQDKAKELIIALKLLLIRKAIIGKLGNFHGENELRERVVNVIVMCMIQNLPLSICRDVFANINLIALDPTFLEHNIFFKDPFCYLEQLDLGESGDIVLGFRANARMKLINIPRAFGDAEMFVGCYAVRTVVKFNPFNISAVNLPQVTIHIELPELLTIPASLRTPEIYASEILFKNVMQGKMREVKADVISMDIGDPSRLEALGEETCSVYSMAEYLQNLFYVAVASGQKELVMTLLRAGVSVHLPDQGGFFPLYFAAQNNCLEIVRILLEAGALVDSNNQGMTPLYAAAKNGYLAMVKILYCMGANCEVRTADATLLEIAQKKQHQEVIEFLRNPSLEATEKRKQYLDNFAKAAETKSVPEEAASTQDRKHQKTALLLDIFGTFATPQTQPIIQQSSAQWWCGIL